MQLALLISLLTSVVLAQDIRLDNFIDEALQNNPGLKLVEKQFRVREQDPDQVSTLPDPVLGFTQWLQPVETRVGPQQNIFSLSQKIPFPGKLGLKEDIALQTAAVSRLNYDIAHRDLVYNIKDDWYNLFLTDRSIEILNDYRVLLKDFVSAAAARYATGQGIQAQVLKAQVEYSSIQVRLQDLNRKRSTLVSKLNQARNKPAYEEIPKVTMIDTSFGHLLDDNLLEKALANRSELKSVLARKESAQFQKKLANTNWLPDFTLQANYITVQDKNSPASDAGTDAWGVMVGLNLPLWQPARNAAVKQAQQQIYLEEARHEEVKTKIINEIYDLKYQAQSTQETLVLYKTELLPQAENTLESSFSAYRSGNISFLDLLDAERMLLQLRLSFVKEQVNYRQIIAALERAVETSTGSENRI